MGMGEILIIAVIGLLVLGPERMPIAIRTVVQWIKSAKQMATAVSTEINQELKISELHQNLKKAEEQGLNNLSPELNDSLQELRDAAASVTRPYAQAEPEDDPYKTATPNDNTVEGTQSNDAPGNSSNDNSKS